MRIGQLDVEFLGSLDNGNAITSADVMGDLGGAFLGLHQKGLQFGNVIDDNLSTTVRHQELGELARTVADLWHGKLALETSANTVINTFGFTPVFLNSGIAVRLMTLKLLGTLLNNNQLSHLDKRRWMDRC